MAFFGAGTRSSPIAFVDSEDEAHELYKDSNPLSSSSFPVSLEKPPISLPLQPPKPAVVTESASIFAYVPSIFHFLFLKARQPQPQPQQWDGKRKRTHSFASHDGPMVGPSAPQRSYTTLENRLSQPESKKARKRRRKAERQALEDAHKQNLNYGPSPFTSGVPILPLRSWSSDVQMFGGFLPPHYTDHASLMQSGLINGFTPSFNFAVLPEPDDLTLYDNREPHSVSPPPPPSHWVSSMAKAASDPIDSTKTEEHNELSQWSPLSTQKNLPPFLPSSLPPHAATHNNNSRLNLSTPVEHHALPPKPPPPQTTIGMKPDQDPYSKHGIFQLTFATKEAGMDVRKKGPLYMPNPARTLVMEQLPKSHRNPDFINSWSRRACSALPVHMFIDVPGGKALIEFTTAELARKAWASPKLASTHAHKVKGKSREDLIKVWWYRVDGVGAGSGVGEIEEGEIEGDAIEKDADQLFKKETKEKKARLAKEREEKRVKRELESRLIKQRHTSLRVELPTSSTSSSVPENSYQRGITPVPLSPHWPVPDYPCVSPPWSPIIAQAQYLPNASDLGNRNFMEWGRPSDNWVENPGPLAWFVQGDLDDYEYNMEVDVPQLPLPHPTVRPAVQTLLLHSSLPPRPASTIVAPHPRVAVPPPALPPQTKALPSSQPIYEVPPPPPAAPSPPSPSSSTPPRTPSEPRAMKNAPTEPSYTKRALMARQKELEEKIAKSKLELAETRTANGSTTKPVKPVSSLQPADDLDPVKPSMDLGEKQAMEDRLRKLVLQSQIAKGKAGSTAISADNSNVSVPSMAASSDAPLTSPSISASSSSSSSVPSPVVLFDSLSQLTAVSLSAHNFSLEDLAVSFITQTIEIIKSKPSPTPTSTQTPTAISIDPSNKSTTSTTQYNIKTTMKLELAAKQRRLEQHITESKKMMSNLAQARTKEEKDTILKAMREMTRCVTMPLTSVILVVLFRGFQFD